MRNPFFDVLKFVAIMLVIYGHACKVFNCSFNYPILGDFIVGMNMPLFFVISGYFAARTIETGDWKKLGRHLLGYFWPMATTSIAFAVLAIVFGLPGSENGLVGYAGRNFLFMPWFLWCLSACFVLIFLCFRVSRFLLRVSALLALVVLLPFVVGVWHADEIRSMLPHFCFGVFVLRRWELWKSWKVGVPCLGLYLIALFIPNGIDLNWRSFYVQDSSWVGFWHENRLAGFYLARIVNGIVGSVGVMWLLQCVIDRFGNLARLAPFGRTTLGVYLLHYWLLQRVVELGFATSSVWAVILWTFVIFLACHTIVWATKRMNWVRKFVWGEWW